MRQRLAALAALFSMIFVSEFALGQASLELSVSAGQVEVDERVKVVLSATTAGGESPSAPQLNVPKSFVKSGPSVSSQQQVSMVNGRVEHRVGLTATWTVWGTRPGKFALGPASVRIGQRTVQSETANVEVVAKGKLPAQRRQRHGRAWPFGDPLRDFDPFDMLPNVQRLPRLDDFDRMLHPPSSYPEEIRVDRAPDLVAFLRALVTPKRAVVGQQVTLRIYAYGSRGPFGEINTSEPSRPDFVSHVIVEDSQRQPRYRVPINDHIWYAVKVREVALFPIRTGSLTIGSMKMGFRGGNYAGRRSHTGLVRRTEPLEVVVTEPPLAGRPPGYQLGDVGQFSLDATVEPRLVDAGGAISVVLELEGTGNLPPKLRPPQKKGVEWLEPTITESIEADGAVIGGWRKFSYVVRMTEPGRHDLGTVELPYYDPSSGRYAIARANLGTVEVRPSPGQTGAGADDDEGGATSVLARLEPRTELGPPGAEPWRLADSVAFWLLLVAGPLGVLGIGGGARLAKGLRDRYRRKRSSKSAQSRQALRKAREALDDGNAAQTATALERAVYTAIDDATGLKARAILRSDLSHELTRHGVTDALATETVDLLDACDNLRFGSNDQAEEVVSRTSDIVTRFAKLGKSNRRSRSAA